MYMFMYNPTIPTNAAYPLSSSIWILIYNKATTPAAKAKTPGTWNIISPEDLAAVAEADAEPVADEATLEVADPADPAVLEAADPAEEEAAEPEETVPGAPKVPPVPMTMVGVTIVTFLAALM